MENNSKKATENTTAKKRRIKKWPFIVGGIVLTVIIAVVLLFTLSKPPAGSSVKSAAVSENDIVTTVTGTGSLTSAEAEDIKLPSGLEIEKVLVDEGDMVGEGDPIATVNTASVLTLIETVESELKDVDTKINKSENGTTTESVKTYVDGRVKAVYVSEGDSARAAISEYGSLMIISIGGTMEVSVEADIAIGTNVTLLFTDGTTADGVCESFENGISTVTFSDEFGTLGEEAAVKDESGSTLGTGTVAISEAIEIVAPSGTVTDIYADVNDKVSGGKTLIKLTEVSASPEYEQYLDRRGELLDMLRTLSSLASDGVVRAPFSGIIGSLYISDESAVSASASAGASASQASGSVYSWMSARDASDEPAITLLSASDSTVTVLDLTDMDFAAPAAGALPVAEITDIAAYKAAILWDPADMLFAADTVYKAEFTLTANAGFTFPASISPVLTDAEDAVIPAVITDVLVSGTGEGNVLTFKAEFPKTGSAPADNTGSTGAGSTGSTGGIGSISGISGISGSYGGYSSSSYSSASDSSSVENVAAFTLAPDDTINISINVDELDILSVNLGQTARIEVDALEGEIFEGEITDIANNATSGGGTAKYTVDITLPRSENMKNGMSASATVIVSENIGVMTIPTEAIQEQGNRVFVYTSADAEGNLGGEVDIETGVSDGLNTEIISGISTGDTVYYISTETDIMTQMFNMMMNGTQGGNAPERGEAPDFGGERPQR